jgi:exopolysaccharide biosynthesis polyprenyl glycosylphosphotransferase
MCDLNGIFSLEIKMKIRRIVPLLIIPSIIIIDILFIILADLASFIIRFNGFPRTNFQAYLQLSPYIVAIRLVCFYIFRLYSTPKYKSDFETLINVLKACTSSSIIIIFFLYFMNIESYPRTIASLSWLLAIIFITSWRFILKSMLQSILGREFFYAHIIIIGTDENARDAAIFASRDASIEYNLLGFVSTGSDFPTAIDETQVLGTLDNLPSIVRLYPIDKVIIAEPGIEKKKLAKLVSFLTGKGIMIKLIPYTYGDVISNMIMHDHAASFVSSAILTKPVSWYWGLKRVLDIIFSIIILVVTLPVLAIAIAAIKLTSPGPVFYLQKRTGLNGARFTMYKLRTMRSDAEKAGKPRWAKAYDTRVTPVGRILRRFRIDELPQLINVLRNEMSMIGPRPERPYFTAKLIRKIPFYAERLRAKPGITGWAQVNFRYAASEEDTEEKLVYDLFYIQNVSFALDLLVVLKTFKVVLTGQGAQ